MQVLDVFLHEKLIGHLQKTRKGAKFLYVDGLCKNLPLLSTSLPVKDAKYNEGLTGSWFRGLLPEGYRLKALSKAICVPEYDYFSILERIGYECAGAVQILPHKLKDKSKNALNGTSKSKSNDTLIEIPKPNIKAISKKELKNLLQELSSNQVIDTTFSRMSLGGYQEKLCVICENNALYLPNETAISTHIIKPENPQYPGLAESEAWAMTAASSAAKVAKVKTCTVDKINYLLIRRFDRQIIESQTKRIHQEDFCMSLGIPTENKYANIESEKGDDPSYKKVSKLIFNYSINPIEELKELARQVIVNVCLGNYDAHAKNYSFIHDDNSFISISPMYDVVPVAEVEPRTEYLSLRIDGKIVPNEISRNHVVNEIKSWGLSSAIVENVFDDTLQALKLGISKADKQYPDAAKKHSSAALKRIESFAT